MFPLTTSLVDVHSSSLPRRQALTGLPAGERHGTTAPSPQELFGFFQHAPEPIAVLDARGRILEVNPAAEGCLGYSASDLSDRRSLRFIHPDDRAEVRERLRKGLSTRRVQELSCRVCRADGRWLPMQWSVSFPQGTGRIYAIGRDRGRNLRRRERSRVREDASLRATVADELHDGILQAMTAGGLQLEAARRLIRTDPAAAEAMLERLIELVEAEQKEIRLFVDEMKREEPLASGRASLAERVGGMLERVEAIWGVSAVLASETDGDFGPMLERSVLRIVQEAVVNAIRHGEAIRVKVRIEADRESVTIRVVDNGSGFPFRGELSDQELRERRLGPVTLKRRVSEAGGHVSIRSTSRGATVVIVLPRGEALR